MRMQYRAVRVSFIAAAMALTALPQGAFAQSGTPPPYLCARAYHFGAASEKSTVSADTGGAVNINTVHFVKNVNNDASCESGLGIVMMSVIIKCPGQADIATSFGPFFLTKLGFTTFPIVVNMPAGSAGKCTVEITSNVTFSDGQQVTQTVNHPVDMTPGAVGDTGTPNIEVTLLNVGATNFGPPSQGGFFDVEITNNSPDQTWTGSVTAMMGMVSDEAEVIAGQDDNAIGVFGVTNNNGNDTFPVNIGDILFPPCFAMSDDPSTVGPQTATSDEFELDGWDTTTVRVNYDSYPLSPDGAMGQLSVRAEGTFADGTSASACATGVVGVDTSMPPPDMSCPDDVAVNIAVGLNTPVTPGVGMAFDCGDGAAGQINFCTDESQIELTDAIGIPFGGTTGFSGPGPVAGAFGRLIVEISFLNPIGSRDEDYTFKFPINFKPDETLGGEIQDVLLLDIRAAGGGPIQGTAPVSFGTLCITMKDGRQLLVDFTMQLESSGIEQGSFDPVEMTVDDINVGSTGTGLSICIMTHAVDDGGTAGLIGYSTTVDFSSVVRKKPPPPCPADYTGDGILDFFDVQGFLTKYGNGTGDPVPSPPEGADFIDDDILNFFDVQEFLTQYSSGCP